MENLSKDNRINEMAKDLGIAFQLAGTTHFGAVAEVLVNAGYRKASEVAREIFEDFRIEMRSLIETSKDLYITSGEDDYYLGKEDAFFTAILHLDELIKKKYTENL